MQSLGVFDDTHCSVGSVNLGLAPSTGTAVPCPEPAALTGPSTSGETYYTRDLFTEPPTVVHIVATLPRNNSGSSGFRQATGPPMFAVTFADVEATAGWLSDRNNASLDICFMHSFSKCSGKAKEKDPCTCHQIHVKREVLECLRAAYINPQRNYFCRTMKANITEKFAQVLSLLARRRFTLQYLEFKTDDINATSGSTAYEVQYRHWLVSDAATQKADAPHSTVAVNTDNFISTSDLCWDFAVTGRCPKGATCPELHGHVAKALTKDRFVRMALEEMGSKDVTECAAVCQQRQNGQRHVQLPSSAASKAQPQRQQQPQRQPQQKRLKSGSLHGQLPMRHQCLQPAMDSNTPMPFQMRTPLLPTSFLFPNSFPTGSLPPPLPPTQLPPPPPSLLNSLPTRQNATPPAALLSMPNNMSNTMPFFLVSEGADNVLRLISMSSFAQFSNNGGGATNATRNLSDNSNAINVSILR